MLKYRSTVQILAAVAILAMLAGCSVLSPTGSVAATLDPAIMQATLDQAKTQAVQTVVADLTQNAPVATNTQVPTEAPVSTNTLAPTNTEIPAATLPPTLTAMPPTATRVVVLNTPAATQTPNSLTCTLSDVIPASGEDFKPGAPFDAAWTIKNTSSNTWTGNEIDIRYLSGTKMHEGADNRDLTADVAADKTVRVVFDMVAPAGAGRHTETWVITRSGANVCVLSATIDVVP